MMGRWTPLEEIDERLAIKVGKMIGRWANRDSNASGSSQGHRHQKLKAGRLYVLTPTKYLQIPNPTHDHFGSRIWFTMSSSR